MTNTKFRKRALISSVAMLLVALVALGSATFAWFSTSNTANAAGLTMKTVAEKGIAVKTESAADLGFKKSTFLNYDSTSGAASTTPLTIAPASYDFGTDASDANKGKFYTTTTDDASVYKTSNMSAVTEVTPSMNSAVVYAEKIYVKVLGDTASTVNVSASFDPVTGASEDLLDCIRILIVDEDGKVLYYVNGDGTKGTNKFLFDEGTYSSVLSSGNCPAAVTSAQAITDAINSTGTQYVTVYVYLDGEDEHCFSNAVTANSIIENVNVTFTLAA